MHTLAGRARFPDPVDGTLFDVNGWYRRLAAQRRLIAWHIKDADRIPMPTAGTNPFSQQHVRPRFPLNGGVDVVYVGEGSIGKGYPCDIDPEVLGFRETFARYRLSAPGWFHTESDSGPGPATDPGRSLRWAKVSAAYMRSLHVGHHGHRVRAPLAAVWSFGQASYARSDIRSPDGERIGTTTSTASRRPTASR
jgi:hypothetical protein